MTRLTRVQGLVAAARGDHALAERRLTEAADGWRRRSRGRLGGDTAVSKAPVEEVWKLLYDPARFPEWWVGVETVRQPTGDSPGGYTMYPNGYPDFPMPQTVDTSAEDRRIVISCLVSDLRFRWRLEPLPHDTTQISVHVDIPDKEAHRLDAQRDAISRSVRRLADLAGQNGRG